MIAKLNKSQLQAVVRSEGCDCTDWQWDNRASHCTMTWIRCNGRWSWKRANDAKFRKVWGLEASK